MASLPRVLGSSTFSVDVENRSYNWSLSDLQIYLGQLVGDLNIDYVWPATNSQIISDSTYEILRQLQIFVIFIPQQEALRTLFANVFNRVLDVRAAFYATQLNAETEVLDVRALKGCSVLQFANLIEKCPNATEVNCDRCDWISPDHLEHLSKLIHLKKLTLSNCKGVLKGVLSGKRLKPLCNLKTLEELYLSNLLWITGVDLIDLRHLTLLKVLDLSGSSPEEISDLDLSGSSPKEISDNDLIHLQVFNHLERLLLVGCKKITKLNLKCFRLAYTNTCTLCWGSQEEPQQENTWTLSDLRSILSPLILPYNKENLWELTNKTAADKDTLDVLEWLGLQIERAQTREATKEFREIYIEIVNLYQKALANVRRLQFRATHLDRDTEVLEMKNLSACTALQFAELAQRCPQITTISFQGCKKVDAAYFTELRHFLNLKTLDLSGCPVTDDSLGHLIYVESLEFLNLSECNEITDVGAAYLSFLKNLSVLNMSYCFLLTNNTLLSLQGLPQLRKLILIGCKHIEEESVISFRIQYERPCKYNLVGGKHLRTWTSSDLLTYLSQFSSFDEKTKCKLTHKKILSVETYKLLLHLQPRLAQLQATLSPNKHIKPFNDAIAKFPSLLLSMIVDENSTELDMSVLNQCTSRELEKILKNHSKATSINFKGCPWLTGEHLAYFRHAPQVRCLNFTGCINLQNNDLVHLQQLPYIEELNLSKCTQLADAGCIRLLLPTLKKLDLSYCSITGSCFNTLEFPLLKYLNLRSCLCFDEQNFEYVSRITSLKILDLSETLFRDILSITNLANLKELRLHNCKELTDQGLHYLGMLTHICSLDLSQCMLSDACLEHLQLLKNLYFLNVSGCEYITEAAVKFFRITGTRSCNYLIENEKPGTIWTRDDLKAFARQVAYHDYKDIHKLWNATRKPIISRNTLEYIQDLIVKIETEGIANDLVAQEIFNVLSNAENFLRLFLDITEETSELYLTVACSVGQIECLFMRCPNLLSIHFGGNDWVEDEHITMLKHLIHLRTINLSNCQWVRGSTLHLLPTYNELETLDFSHCIRLENAYSESLFVKHYLNLFDHFPNLKYLDFTGCRRLTSNNFIKLSQCIQLQSLNFSGCNLQDHDLMPLTTAILLKTLNLSKCPITDAAFVYLRSFNQLTSLNVSDCKNLSEVPSLWFRATHPNPCGVTFDSSINGSYVTLSLEQLKIHLRAFCLHNNQNAIWEASHAPLLSSDTMNLLNILELQINHIDAPWEVRRLFNNVLNHIETFKFSSRESRTHLCLSNRGSYTANNFESLLKTESRLTHLSLKGCQWVTSNHLAKLEQFPHIQYLDLSESSVTDDALRYVGLLTNLTRLYLRSCSKLKGEGIAQLATLSKLEHLDISGCVHLEDKHFVTSKSWISLLYLNLANCAKLTGQCLEYLGPCDTLSHLDLSFYNLNGDFLRCLNKFPCLHSLKLLSCIHITPENLIYLEPLEYLRELYLAEASRISEHNLILPYLPRLQYINLSHIREITAINRQRFLQSLPQLQRIDVKNGQQVLFNH
ncbi:MAG: hypothetical protein P4L16_05510 [Chlamydiales bacterium]|nr:hypothetical protein [Chlamydiales bacterium]